MYTIVVYYPKGGVGKTTTCVNLAAGLGRKGKTVLIADLDQQGSITKYFLGKDDKLDMPTIYDVLLGGKDGEGERIEPIVIGKGVGLLPANQSLAAANLSLYNAMDRDRILSNALSEYYHLDYDYIILDCGPNLDLLTINALVACQYLIVPVSTEFLSYLSLKVIMEQTIPPIKKRPNKDLRIWKILPTMYDTRNNKHHQQVLEVMLKDEKYGSFTYPHPVLKRAAYTHASVMRSDVSQVDPKLGEYWDTLTNLLIEDVEGKNK